MTIETARKVLKLWAHLNTVYTQCLQVEKSMLEGQPDPPKANTGIFQAAEETESHIGDALRRFEGLKLIAQDVLEDK